MIVQDRSQWLSLMLSWRGSVFAKIWRRIAFVGILSIAVTYANLTGALNLSLTVLPFTLVGLPLAIFLGFRNNTSYDRFWEGRKLWGRLINTSRSLTRQILTLVVPDASGQRPQITEHHRALIYRIMAYVHALRMHLRGHKDLSELAPFLDANEVAGLQRESNPPIALLQALGDRLRDAWKDGWVDPLHVQILEGSLTTLTDIQGGCERIRATPIPFGYAVLMHRVVAFYCLGLPFGIAQQVGMLTPVVVGMISYAFFGLDALGDELEDPFGVDSNDLPLSQLSTMIEINLRERLGETDLPQAKRPVNGLLI